MKQRLLFIVLFLMGLYLSGTALYDAVIRSRLEIFELGFGVYCILFGGYKSLHPD